MKIGIMLRHLGQYGGGVKTYTVNLMQNLLSLKSPHQFVLIYSDSRYLGTFKDYENVREIAFNMPFRPLWDQIATPLIARQEKIDLLFNPKYSVPFWGDCPSVFVCHGLNSYLMPWGSKRLDRAYRQYVYPSYVRKASSIIAVSDTAKKQLIDFLNVAEEKIHTVYHGVHESFRKKITEDEQGKIKSEYNLPDRYFLFAGQILPLKNLGRLLQAYAEIGPRRGIHLVLAGEHRWLCEEELRTIGKLGISDWIVQAGWLDHEKLRYFYKMAEALLFPSLYESFGIPIIEAMAAGCPVITSDRFGTKEVGGEAVLLVDPENVASIAEGIRRVATDKELRERLIQKGYARQRSFSWRKCAEETLKVLETTVKSANVKGSSDRIFRLKPSHQSQIIKPPPKLLDQIGGSL